MLDRPAKSSTSSAWAIVRTGANETGSHARVTPKGAAMSANSAREHPVLDRISSHGSPRNPSRATTCSSEQPNTWATRQKRSQASRSDRRDSTSWRSMCRKELIIAGRTGPSAGTISSAE